MKTYYKIAIGVLAVLVIIMFVGRIMNFPDDVIRTVGILMIIDLPFVSFTAVRSKNERDEDRKKNEEK